MAQTMIAFWLIHVRVSEKEKIQLLEVQLVLKCLSTQC